jgi:MFS family permease
VKGLSPQGAGVILVAQPAVMAACSPFAGRLSDRHEPRVVASAGMGVIVVGLGLFALLDARTPLAAIVGCLMLLGFGFALFSSPNVNAVMGSVDRRLLGVASATLATMRMIGQTLSMGLAALVIATRVGRFAITPEFHPAFIAAVRAAFALFALLCVGGTFASLARGRARPGPRSTT